MTFEKDLNDILRGSQYTIYNKQDDIEANLNSSVFRADCAANLSLSYQAHISPLSLALPMSPAQYINLYTPETQLVVTTLSLWSPLSWWSKQPGTLSMSPKVTFNISLSLAEF